MKERIVFLAKFFASALVFFLIWLIIGSWYVMVLAYLSLPILNVMGYQVMISSLDPLVLLFQGGEMNFGTAALTNYNLVAYLALVIATPFTLNRLQKNLILGLPLLFISHLVDLIAHFPLYSHGNIVAYFIVSSSGLLHLVLPFIIWFSLNYELMLPSFRRSKKMYRCPICGKKIVGVLSHLSDVHDPLTEHEEKQVHRFYDTNPELTSKISALHINSINR